LSWWKQPQTAASTGRDATASRPWWLAELWRLSAFFAVAVAFGAVTVWFQYHRAIAEYQLPVGGLPSRIANAGKATWWYLGKAISPVNPWYEMPGRPVETEPEALAVLAGTRGANPAPTLPAGKLTAWPLAMIYPRWRVTPPVWYDFLPAAGMGALYVLAARHRRGRGRGAFVAFSYLLLALLPVLGLLKMSYMRAAWVADHFQYLANIGVIALGSAAGATLYRRVSQQRRRVLALVGATLIAGYAICTFARALDYRDEYTLWTDTVAKNPGAWQAQIRLGAALLGRHQVSRAAEHFERGVRLKPDNADGRNNLGLALVALGRIDEGIEQYRESIRLNGRQFHAYANLGDLFARQGRHSEATDAYRAAIRLKPRLAPLHYGLGMSLMESGRLDEAVHSLRKAEALAPNTPEVARALARALAR
jgi:tetratricopeptide (TPR) repeat protein